MERHAFALKIREGCVGAFRRTLGACWPDITRLMDHAGGRNFSLWSIGELVFGYYETEADGGGLCGEDDKASCAEVLKRIEKTAEWISHPSGSMRLMYLDPGIVRESKELIRHRVFATRLMPGMQEEYKRRHDELAASRGGAVNPGPDSNFSIWNAGEYIFGYDEIDVTMEEEETETSRAAAIRWETRMLEIMRWITDDVDWITGERHPHVQRIGRHG